MLEQKDSHPTSEATTSADVFAETVMVQQVPRDHDRFVLLNICFGAVLCVFLLICLLEEPGPMNLGLGLLLSLVGMAVMGLLRGIWFRFRKMPVFSGDALVTIGPAGVQIAGLGTTPWSSIQGFHETGDQNGLVVIQVEKQHDLFLSVPDRDQVDHLLASLAFYGQAGCCPPPTG